MTLRKPWISDKQDAFLKCVATEFPGVPHRYCENHFFRDLAKPVLDLDSTAKTKMRAKIRGLRALEREILEAREAAARPSSVGRKRRLSLAGASGDVVLDYCSVVRGILNDNHGGPVHPAGLRMLEALGDVQKSFQHVASSGKVGPAIDLLARLKGFVSNRPTSLVEAACFFGWLALPPTTCRIVGSTQSRSASLTSS